MHAFKNYMHVWVMPIPYSYCKNCSEEQQKKKKHWFNRGRRRIGLRIKGEEEEAPASRDKKMMYKSSVDDDDDGAPSGWYRVRRAQYIARRTLYMDRLTRVRESTYDSSHPTRFGETSCVVCLHDFTNTQTLLSLPCEHIFSKECISTYIFRYKLFVGKIF
ncbi:RING finger protein [Medicago truncatula]|uniref:RING finger protein n=1 Tax=Medicago truncatula TaxID=3880 RepID=G7L9P7_MEDTR|nr:RING finger protein [Medicago truncatula]